jgi:putative transposase
MIHWFSAKELAGSPEMPSDPTNVVGKARKEGWEWRRRKGRGGPREYPGRCLSSSTRSYLIGQLAFVGSDERGGISALAEVLEDA